MKTLKIKRSLQAGFSLVELLVVIAVIAIIAAIAIPNIANITSQANEAKSQRNAQNIASVASAARAAGYTNNWVDVTAAITALRTGVKGDAPSFTNASFSLSGLSDAEASAAAVYLGIDASTTPDTLLYVAEGSGGGDDQGEEN